MHFPVLLKGKAGTHPAHGSAGGTFDTRESDEANLQRTRTFERLSTSRSGCPGRQHIVYKQDTLAAHIAGNRKGPLHVALAAFATKLPLTRRRTSTREIETVERNAKMPRDHFSEKLGLVETAGKQATGCSGTGMITSILGMAATAPAIMRPIAGTPAPSPLYLRCKMSDLASSS